MFMSSPNNGLERYSRPWPRPCCKVHPLRQQCLQCAVCRVDNGICVDATVFLASTVPWLGWGKLRVATHPLIVMTGWWTAVESKCATSLTSTSMKTRPARTR